MHHVTRVQVQDRVRAGAQPRVPDQLHHRVPAQRHPRLQDRAQRGGARVTYPTLYTCTCHTFYTVHVSQECTEESTVQCYTAEECAPVAATNCVTRPREVCEEVPVQDCR